MSEGSSIQSASAAQAMHDLRLASKAATARDEAAKATAVQTQKAPTQSQAQSQAQQAKEAEEAPTAAALQNTRLTVSLDAETGTFIYRSVNKPDGEVVWQWPSEQVMRVIQYFRRIETLEDRVAPQRSLDQKA